MKINTMDTKGKKIEFSEEFKKNMNKLSKKIALLGTLTFMSVASIISLGKKEVYAAENIQTTATEQISEVVTSSQKVEIEPGVFIEIEVPEGYQSTYNEETMITLEDNLAVAELINEYSEIYNVDPTLLYQKAKEITNGFTSVEFINQNLIKGTTAAKQERSFETLKAGILCYVRSVAKSPDKFGFTKDEISTGGSYKFNGCYEEMVQKYCDILGYHPEVIVGIAYTECGEGLNSSAFREKNNSSGTMIGGTITEFESLDDGVIFTILNLKYNYSSFEQLGIEGFANKMGPKYCTEGTDNWKRNFKNFTAKASENLFYNAHYIEEGVSRNI